MREAEYVSMNRLTEICDGAGGMTKSPPNSRFCKDPAIWREVGFDQGWYKDGDSDVQLGVSLIVLAFVSLLALLHCWKKSDALFVLSEFY